MGSSASKAAKKAYPSAGSISRDSVNFTPPPTTFPTARSSPSTTPVGSTAASASGPAQLETESRPDELERSGGRDPAFLSKLAELGQVSIQDGQATFRGPQSSQPNPAQDLLRRRTLDPVSFPSGSPFDRMPTEAETHNRLDAVSLVALLAARRDAHTPEEVQRVAEAWNVDLAVIDSLARFVNPPLAAPQVAPNNASSQAGDKPKLVAVWSEPIVSPSRARADKRIT